MECIGFLISARGQDALLGLPLFLWAQGPGLRMAPIFKPYHHLIKSNIFFIIILDVHFKIDVLYLYNLGTNIHTFLTFTITSVLHLQNNFNMFIFIPSFSKKFQAFL